MLGSIHRRGVHLHESVRAGFAKWIIEEVTQDPASIESYDRENMFRVIDGLERILAANPKAVFVDPKPAKSTVSFGEALLIARTRALQLVSTSKPWTVLAELPLTPKSSSGVTAVGAPGSRRLIGHTSESVFVWNPFVRAGVGHEFYLSSTGFIARATHAQLRGSIVSLLSTGYTVLRSVDFAPPENTGLRVSGVFSDVAVTDDGRVAVIVDSGIVELVGARGIRSAVTRDQISEAVRKHPGCHIRGDFSLTHSSLKISRLRGVEVISISAYIVEGFKRTGTAILFFDPRSKPWKLVGTAVVNSGDPMDYFLDSRLGGGTRLWLCLKYDRSQSGQNLIIWCDGVETREGIVFRLSGSFGQHTDDLVSIVVVDEDRGFVSDGSGGLLSFSKSTGELIEIQKEPSRICSLELCFGKDLALS
jgi:hypothetical protein